MAKLTAVRKWIQESTLVQERIGMARELVFHMESHLQLGMEDALAIACFLMKIDEETGRTLLRELSEWEDEP